MDQTSVNIAPPSVTMPYAGTGKTVQIMLEAATGPRGAQSPQLRYLAESIIGDVQPRDILSQLAAIYNWFTPRYHYVWDPTVTELVRDPLAVVEAIQAKGKFLGDCDCAATFLTGMGHSIGIKVVPIRVGFLKPRKVAVPSGAGVVYKTLGPFSHVLAVARDQYGRIVALDPVAGDKTWRMLRRAKIAG